MRTTTVAAFLLAVACSSPPAPVSPLSIPGPDLSGGARLLRAAVAAPAAPRPMDPEVAAIVAQIPTPAVTGGAACRGHAWTFAEPRLCGRYWNGEPWVVGPVTVTDISPAPVDVGGRRMNGSMRTIQRRWNQYGGTTQGFDGGQDYDPALDVSRHLPLTLAPGESLVSTRSDPAREGGTLSRSCAVLTVLAAPPAEPTFRPGYWGPEKVGPVRLADVDLSRLPTALPASYAAANPSINAASIEQMAARARATWLVAGVEWVSYLLHPRDVVPPYYRDKMVLQGEMLLALCSSVPRSAKTELALGLAQYGLDVMGAVRCGAWWDGGHGPGRKSPVLFAGLLTGAPECTNPNGFCRADMITAGGFATTHHMVFGEDHTTFDVALDAQGRVNGGHGNYSLADVGNADWGNWHWTDPSRDDSNWLGGTGYRFCCWANGWIGECLAMRMMGLQEAWDHDPYFRYTDRYFRFCTAHGLPGWQRCYSARAEAAWLAYRKYDLPGSNTVGPVVDGAPQLLVTIPPYHDQTWTVDVLAGAPGRRVGLLVRSHAVALRPERSWYGIGTDGLVYLEQSLADAAAPFETDESGRVVVSLPASSHPPGTEYSLQAVILDGGVLRTTNAVEVITLEN